MGEGLKMKDIKSTVSKRRLKYGSLAVALTVLLIALVIVLNAAVYAITYSFGWYLDLTGERYYGITDKSRVYLDSALTSDTVIEVIFCKEKDKVLDDSQAFFIYKCIESYKKEYPNNIKISFVDINKHPEQANEFKTQHGEALQSFNIVMKTNRSKNVRVLNYDNFFTYDSTSNTIYAFKGELCFTSYILSFCQDTPVCYFVTGHGEVTGDTDARAPIWEMLADVGFEIKEINLYNNDIDDAQLVVINAPIYDFGLEEIEKLNRYMDNGGNAMVFLDTEAMTTQDKNMELTNFKGFLKDWGVEVLGKLVDNTNSLANTSGYSIIADYPIPEEGEFAASLHDYMRERDSQPMTVIDNALALNCVWKNEIGGILGQRAFDTILYSHTTAKLGTLADQYSIAALVRNTSYVEEQPVKSYMLVTSAGYADEDYLNSSVYGNRDIIYMLADQQSKDLIPVGIDIKPFDSEELSISDGMGRFWTVLLTAVLPGGVLTAGLIICYRRKRS